MLIRLWRLGIRERLELKVPWEVLGKVEVVEVGEDRDHLRRVMVVLEQLRMQTQEVSLLHENSRGEKESEKLRGEMDILASPPYSVWHCSAPPAGNEIPRNSNILIIPFFLTIAFLSQTEAGVLDPDPILQLLQIPNQLINLIFILEVVNIQGLLHLRPPLKLHLIVQGPNLLDRTGPTSLEK